MEISGSVARPRLSRREAAPNRDEALNPTLEEERLSPRASLFLILLLSLGLWALIGAGIAEVIGHGI